MNISDLYAYQREAVSFMVGTSEAMNGKPHKFVALPPGSGKTPVTCAAASLLELKTGLVICPPSIKDTWARQMVDWEFCRPEDIEVIRKGDQILTSRPIKIVGYQMLLNQNIQTQLHNRRFDFAAVDEAHRIKTLSAKTSQIILGERNKHKKPLIARAKYKWYLSGTPMPNRPMELYLILKTNAPELLGKYDTREKFGFRFCGARIDDRGQWNFKGASNLDELNLMVRPFILFKTLEEVLPDLPEVVESFVYFNVGELEFDESNAFESTVRKCVGLAKVPYIIEYINDRFEGEPEEKILCFAHHREVCEQIAASRPNARLVYGGLSEKVKQAAIDAFIDDPTVDLLVMQDNCGSEAIDRLQHVCYNYISAEPDWVPGNEDQALGRLRRIGQKHNVNAVRCIAIDTMDERVVGSSRKKRKNITNTFCGDQQMSLESEIVELIKAVRENTAALKEAGKAPGPSGKKGTGKDSKQEQTPESGSGVATTTPTGAPATDASAPSTAATNTQPVATPSGNDAPNAGSPATAPTPVATLPELKDMATKLIQLVVQSGGEQDAAVKLVLDACKEQNCASLNDMADKQDMINATWARLKPTYDAMVAKTAVANPLAALGL